MASIVSIAKIYVTLANAKKPHTNAYLPDNGGMGFQAMFNYFEKRNCVPLTAEAIGNGLMYRIGTCFDPFKFRGRIAFTTLGNQIMKQAGCKSMKWDSCWTPPTNAPNRETVSSDNGVQVAPLS